MSEQQKAAEPGAAPTGAEAKPPEAEAPKALSPEEATKVLAALKAANAEAKSYREKLDAEAARVAAAEKAKAEAEGNVVKLREIEQADRKRIESERDALKPLADAASRYEATLKAEAEARLATLPEAQRAFAATLPIEQQLAYARIHSTAQAAPPPARTPGAPGGTQPPVNLADMDQKQIEKFFLSNPKAFAEWRAGQNKQRNTF